MKNNQLKNIALVALTLLLAGALFYIFNLKKEVEEVKESQVKTQTELGSQKELYLTQIGELEFEIDSIQNNYNLKDDELISTLRQLSSKKDELKKMLNSKNLSDSQLRSLKTEIANLKTNIRNYRIKIQQLELENKNLRLTNDTLRIINDSVNTQYANTQTQYNEASTKLENRENLIQNTVSVSNFSITPIRVRNNGKEVEKTNSKRVNKLKVNFSLDPNENGSDEDKLLYICIHKPNGELAQFKNASNGVFTAKNGNQISYSDKLTVPYNPSTGKNVEFEWDYENFTEGTYKIDVYQNGFKIAQASQTLD